MALTRWDRPAGGSPASTKRYATVVLARALEITGSNGPAPLWPTSASGLSVSQPGLI